MLLKVLCLIAIYGSGGNTKPAETEEYPPQDLVDMTKPLHDVCVEQNGITDDDVKNYVITNNSPEMMCYMQCIFLSAGWILEDGTIQYDFIEATVHPAYKPYIVPALSNCHDVAAGTHRCEKSYNLQVCLEKQDPEVIAVKIGSK